MGVQGSNSGPQAWLPAISRPLLACGWEALRACNCPGIAEAVILLPGHLPQAPHTLIQEAEAGGLGVSGHPPSHSETLSQTGGKKEEKKVLGSSEAESAASLHFVVDTSALH